MKHRVWVEIDLATLVANYRKITAKVSPAEVMCVLKANAFGLGVRPYARTLAKAGCRVFGVAEPFEALELKQELSETVPELAGACEVQVLSSVLPDEIDSMVESGVTLPVVDPITAKAISSSAAASGKVARIHFKLDTGMGRLGVVADCEEEIPSVLALMKEVKSLPSIECEGVFSHFSMAYDPHDPFTKKQIAVFRKIVAEAGREGLVFDKVHIAASDAINNFPECSRPPFNMVRTGINLHGSFDPNGRHALNVEPVLALKTRVAQVRSLPAGMTIGYGRTWCLRRPARVATISAGYADGLPLALSNRGKVIIGGRLCPVIGRVSMDYTTVDVSDVPGVSAGDEVICFGRSGDISIAPDDWAVIKGTHAYDILCSLGSRVERIAVPGRPD